MYIHSTALTTFNYAQQHLMTLYSFIVDILPNRCYIIIRWIIDNNFYVF